MKFARKCSVLLPAIIAVLFIVNAASAQDTSAAVKAYKELQAKIASSAKKDGNSFRGVGVAVSKYEKVGATIDLAVGVDAGAKKLNALEFSAQPLAVKTGLDGKKTFEPLADPSSMKPALAKTIEIDPTIDNIATTSRLTIRTPEGTAAVKVIVRDLVLNTSFSMILALKDETTTGAIRRQ